MVEHFEVQLRVVSGLRLRVKDGLLQSCVLLARLLVRYQAPQASRHFARASSRGGFTANFMFRICRTARFFHASTTSSNGVSNRTHVCYCSSGFALMVPSNKKRLAAQFAFFSRADSGVSNRLTRIGSV
jgi:hypothetical protein